MPSSVALDLIALHRLTVAAGQPADVEHIGAATADRLPPDTVEQLATYVANLDRRDELHARGAMAGYFDPAEPSELSALRGAASEDGFEQASRAAMQRLAGRIRANATSGVILFLRDGDSRLVCLKLDPGPVTHTRVDSSAQAPALALDVATLQDVLPPPGDLKKGAMIPSPSGADVRVVDVVKGNDAAGYWVDFLGVSPIRASVIATNLHDASLVALEREQVEPERALALVAERWDAAIAAQEPVPASDFVRAVAQDARVDEARAWQHATEASADLADRHAVVAPVTAKLLKRTIELGDGVRITGPAAQVDRRVEEGQDAQGWFVKVRATRRPEYRTG
jgi:biotin carboxyl carrier protein